MSPEDHTAAPVPAQASSPGNARGITRMRKRLLFVITTLGWGGAESQVIDLALQFKARGWDVAVAVLLATAERRDVLEAAGVPVHTLGMQRGIPDPRGLLRLAQLVRQFRPGVLHSHMVHANLLARLVRLFAPVPVMVTSAHNVNEGASWRAAAYRMTDRLTDLTTNVSDVAVQRSIERGAVSKERVRSMPNGVDLRRFRRDTVAGERMRGDLCLDGRFVWLAVGRFEEQKDYPNLLRAFAAVRSHPRDPTLLIVGDGPLRQQIEAMASDLGMGEAVRFLGLRQDIPDLMSTADAYVMSSAWEGLPIVLLEAAASGLPIVATEVGGNAQIARDEESGYLVPSGDSRGLARAMTKMMNLPDATRTAWGEQGAKHVRIDFGLESIAARWESVFVTLQHQKAVR